MGRKGQVSMVCCRNSVETRGATQPLRERRGASNLPPLQSKDKGLLQPLSDLLELACRNSGRDKEEPILNTFEHNDRESLLKDVQGMDEGEVDMQTTDKKRSTLQDLLEQMIVQEDEGKVKGFPLEEQQENKYRHPLVQKNELEEVDQSEWDVEAGNEVGVPPEHVVVAVSKHQSSKDALIWTLTHLVPPAAAITLLHVRSLARNNTVHSQGIRNGMIAQLRDAQLRATEIVQQNQRACSGEKVDSKFVIVDGDSVAKTLVEQVTRLQITKLVLGASPRNFITLKRKGAQTPAFVAKHAPPFCTVMVISKNRLISMKKAHCLPSGARYLHYISSLNVSNTNRQSVQQGKDQLPEQSSNTKVVSSQIQKCPVEFGHELCCPIGQRFRSQLRPSSRNGRHERSSSIVSRSTLSCVNTRGELGEPDAHYEKSFLPFSSSPDGNCADLKPLISSELHWNLYKNAPSTPVRSVSEPSSPAYHGNEPVFNTWNIRLHKKLCAHGRDNVGMAGPRAAASAPRVLAGYRSAPQSPTGRINLYSDGMKFVKSDKHELFDFVLRDQTTVNFMGFKLEMEPLSVDLVPSLTVLKSPSLLDEVDVLRVRLEQAQMAVEIARKDAEANAQCRRVAEEAAAKALCKAQEFAAKQLEEAKMKEEALWVAEAAELHATEEARKCSKALELARVTQYALEEEMQLRKKAEERAKQEMQARQVVLSVLQKTQSYSSYREYDYQELRSACDSFAANHKLGEGGYGIVYQGKLHHTTVAIKVLNPGGVQGPKEFQREVELLGRIHHPHMVMLLGCCPERGCLVYEYMANGSLEDRLICKGNTPPLRWNTRLRIAAEVATALLFLHSSRPEPIVHRDLKPANVLLDKNFVSKIGDVGLARLVPERYPGSKAFNSTYFRDTIPVGTFAYIDPEYQRTGSFGPKSDVYALGILILQLLTSRSPVGVYEVVEEALDNGTLEGVLDYTAGEWPFEETREVARLALECAEMRRRNRPDLETRVLPVLDRMRNFAEGYTARDLYNGRSVTKAGESVVPAMFICPIYQELMEDPVIAADGHTYEYEAIQQWIEEHQTSPMTNLRLTHKELTPNHLLRSAICEWETSLRERDASSNKPEDTNVSCQPS